MLCSGTQLPNLIKQTDIWVKQKAQADRVKMRGRLSGETKQATPENMPQIQERVLNISISPSIAGPTVKTGCVNLFITSACNLFHFKPAILFPCDFKVAARWLSPLIPQHLTAAHTRARVCVSPPLANGHDFNLTNPYEDISCSLRLFLFALHACLLKL